MSANMDVVMANNFGLPNDGLANPALRQKKSENCDAEQLLIYYLNCYKRYFVVM